MTIYKLYHDDFIQAKDKNAAENDLFEQNSRVASVEYFDDEKKARAAYADIILCAPVELDSNLFRFDGKILDIAINCDEDAASIEDAFYSGDPFGAETEIG